MHPECRASLSIVDKLVQYYPISPGPVAATLRVRSQSMSGYAPREYGARNCESRRHRDSGDFSIPPSLG